MYSNYGAFVIENDGTYERSAHVHRTTSYVAGLKKNWAYENKSNPPKLKNSASVYFNSDFKQENQNEVNEVNIYETTTNSCEED